MTQLLGLPNEIIYQIGSYLEGNDIESFAETCKLLQAIGHNAVEWHRKMKEKYGNVDFGHHPTGDGRHPLFLLYEMMADPWVHLYPNVMTIGCAYGDEDESVVDEDGDEGEVWAAETSKKHEKEIRQMISACPYVETHEIDAIFGAMAASEAFSGLSACAIYALLLAHLPNIQAIQLDHQPDGWFHVLLDRQIEHIHLSSKGFMDPPGGQQFLNNLIEVRITPNLIPDGRWHDTDYTALGDWGLWAQLPSVRRLVGIGIRIGDVDGASIVDQKFEFRKSHIREVYMSRCNMSGDSMDCFLGSFTNLKTFTFDRGGTHMDWNEYEPHNMILALE